MSNIFLGFELGSGTAVNVPFAHTVVCGQTQASGKTTTLEAMLSRTGKPLRPAMAFLTKRAESAFVHAHRIPPYFKDHADWKFVESILEAMMRERMKYERQWIIRVCQGARSLVQVAANVETALYGDGRQKKAASGFAAGMYLQLHEYFKMLLPELKRLQLDMVNHGSRLTIEPGLNVMDLSEYSTEMQSLAIASTMEEVYQRQRIITVIPEAWEFLPQARNTPVKMAGEALIRKGAAADNFMWLDSQDITGVDKRVLKQVGVWILGVQREINEVEHTLSQMGVPKKLKPPIDAVMQLKRGQFFVCFENVLKLVYVVPSWMPQEIGQHIARSSSDSNERMREAITRYQPKTAKPENQNMDYKEEYENECARSSQLEKELKEMKHFLATKQPAPTPIQTFPDKPAVKTYLDRHPATPEQDEVSINLERQKPELNVTVKRYTITMDDSDNQGRIAVLLSENWFDKSRRVQDIAGEFRARGWMAEKANNGTLNLPLGKMTTMGFLRLVGQGTYQAVEDMKINIKEVRTVA